MGLVPPVRRGLADLGPPRQRGRRGAKVTLAVIAAVLLALVGLMLTGRGELRAAAFAGDGTPRVPAPHTV